MRRLHCPYLGATVELTEERAAHIARMHPDLWPTYRDRLAAVLAEPDEVRHDARYSTVTRLVSRWFNDVLGGKHIVVAVVTDPVMPNATHPRHWIVTAYIARELTQGVTEWKRA